MKRDFENFFTQCFHLGDWLWEDKTTGLTHQQVRTFIDKEAALRICAGVANTSEHRTRSQPNAITARIASVGFDGEGTHVTIDWSEGLHGGTENALDLARRCVAAWDGYLEASGLQSPM